jgi:hypothetical protein
MLAELEVAHPQITELVSHIAITRYGHAMSIPTPGRLRGLSNLTSQGRVAYGRLTFAHADWSGYSIFEESFVRGHLAV